MPTPHSTHKVVLKAERNASSFAAYLESWLRTEDGEVPAPPPSGVLGAGRFVLSGLSISPAGVVRTRDRGTNSFSRGKKRGLAETLVVSDAPDTQTERLMQTIRQSLSALITPEALLGHDKCIDMLETGLQNTADSRQQVLALYELISAFQERARQLGEEEDLDRAVEPPLRRVANR